MLVNYDVWLMDMICWIKKDFITYGECKYVSIDVMLDPDFSRTTVDISIE